MNQKKKTLHQTTNRDPIPERTGTGDGAPDGEGTMNMTMAPGQITKNGTQ